VSVEAIPFRIPMRKDVGSITSAVVKMDSAEHVLVRVKTDDGVEGFGEAHERPTIYGETQQSIVRVITRHIGPAIMGMDPFALERIFDKADKYGTNYTARGALDVAMHDLLGKILGLPVCTLLGGWESEKVPAAAVLSIYTPEKTAEKARALQEQYGVKAFKIKVGIDPERDVLAIKAIREAVGDGCTLYADANQGYTPAVAIRTIQRMEAHGLAWVEEPVQKWDYEGKKRVAASIGIPILLDESVWTPEDVMNNIRNGLGGMISIKAVRTGFYKSRKIANIAAAANIPCLTGTGRDSAIGAVANAHIIAGFKNVLMGELTDFTLYEDTMLTEPLVLKDGFFYLPKGPGLGIRLDEKKLAHYRVNM